MKTITTPYTEILTAPRTEASSAQERGGTLANAEELRHPLVGGQLVWVRCCSGRSSLLRSPGQDEECFVWGAREVLDSVAMLPEHTKNVESRDVACPNPDRLWRRPQQKRELPEVGVL